MIEKHCFLSSILFMSMIQVSLANAIDRSEIEQLKNEAVVNSKKYELEAKQIVEDHKKNGNTLNLEKESFLKIQSQHLKQFVKPNDQKNAQGQLIIFISLSMPKAAIQSLFKEAVQYDATLVLRGLMENSFPKTVSAISAWVQKNGGQGGIQIDPTLFDAYTIQAVPSYVLRKSNTIESPYDVVRGALGAHEALQIIAAEGVAASSVAKELLAHG